MAVNVTMRAPATERTWVLVVLLLSSPAILFAFLHSIWVPGTLPAILDLALVWTITLTGVLGSGATLGALVTTLAATLQSNVATKTKIFLWTLATVSFLACWYASGSSP